MINEKLANSVKKATTLRLYASVTASNLADCCCTFSVNLSNLRKRLGEISPAISFDFNSSTEQYAIDLPKLNKRKVKQALEILNDSPITITAEQHFGALF